MRDYQKSISVNKKAADVYAAITEQLSNWWSSDLSGPAKLEGDHFTIAFGGTSKTFRILEAVPNQKLIWLCEKAYIDMASLKNKAEWVGTKLIWTIIPEGEGSTLFFLHEGLNQSFECYEVCEAGWDHYLAILKTYLTTKA